MRLMSRILVINRSCFLIIDIWLYSYIDFKLTKCYKLIHEKANSSLIQHNA
jgi:hypothetical protein